MFGGADVENRRWGIVKWFKEDKGYGRIMLEGQDGDHVFVHFSEIQDDPVRFPNGFRSLKQGQKVSFELVENPHISDSQRRSAKQVKVIED